MSKMTICQSLRRRSALLTCLFLIACLAGCQIPPLQPGSLEPTQTSRQALGTTDPTDPTEPWQLDPLGIVAPLGREQDAALLEPVLIQLPRLAEDSWFSTWRAATLPDGRISVGGEYGAQDGAKGRVDYYDGAGNRIWIYRRPQNKDHCLFTCAVQLPDGRIVAAGSQTDGASPAQGIITLLDSNGQMIWERIWATDVAEQSLSIDQCLITDDGEILLFALMTGYAKEAEANKLPVLVAGYSQSGEQLWLEKLAMSGQTYGVEAIRSSSGGAYVALFGYRMSNQDSIPFSAVLHLDQRGHVLWRCDLTDEQYQYQVVKMTEDDDGMLWLSCNADWQGERRPIDWQDTALTLRERYRNYAYNPAALLALNGSSFTVLQRVNGAFGASGQAILAADGQIYWLVSLYDDVVQSLPIMSIDHMRLSHPVMLRLAVTDRGLSSFHLPGDKNSDWSIQTVKEDGRPVLVGYEPVVYSEADFIMPTESASVPVETATQPAESKK